MNGHLRIDLEGVRYTYRHTTAVSDVSLSVSAPCVVGLLGPNGAGKTTLMRLVATVLRPAGGSINFSGVSLEDDSVRRQYRTMLGYLPQEFGYWPAFTVLECVAYVGWLRGMTPSDARAGAQAALEAVGMTSLSTRKMRALSGGEKRRVGIAQALVNQPQVLLLDEPTAGLDPERRLHFRQLVREMGERGIVLLSTHLVEDVATICDRVAIMSRGQVAFEGRPEELAARGAGRTTAAASQFERGYLAILSPFGPSGPS